MLRFGGFLLGILPGVRAVLASLILAAALAAIGTAPAARMHAAKLRLIDLAPVTVQGLRFRAGERVTVVLQVKGRYVRKLRASRNGSFVARFALDADRCTAFNLRAAGRSGAAAAVANKPPPDCAPIDPVP